MSKEAKPSVPKFTAQQAQALVSVAARAPLANMQEAEAVSKLLQHFVAWHESLEPKA